MRWGPLLRSQHPEVAAVVDDLAPALIDVLGSDLAGLYLTGSLALGGFSVASSDIDFVALVDVELGADRVDRLQARYTRFREEGGDWARRVEGIHLSLRELTPDGPWPQNFARSYVELVLSGAVERCRPTTQWLVQVYIAREHGVRLAGAAAVSLIPAISGEDLRVAALHDDILTLPLDPAGRSPARSLAYVVLLACRVLFRSAHGRVGTKPGSARWAMRALGDRWAPVIEWALAAQASMELVSNPQVPQFVAHVRRLLLEAPPDRPADVTAAARDSRSAWQRTEDISRG
jgi:streptomycin 3"-adenylyltransferase